MTSGVGHRDGVLYVARLDTAVMSLISLGQIMTENTRVCVQRIQNKVIYIYTKIEGEVLGTEPSSHVGIGARRGGTRLQGRKIQKK